MFKQVAYMNEVFGNHKGNPLDPNWDKLSNQSSNILDEYEELLEALKAKDMIGVRDALCDILVFTLGAYHMTGFDADVDMLSVYESNMSKLCANYSEVKATQEYYNGLEVETYEQGAYPAVCIKSLKDQKDKYGKNYPKDKFLKNVNWMEPEFIV
jgi:predicted HAD superfamily Cof-like phosphohydrolase